MAEAMETGRGETSGAGACPFAKLQWHGPDPSHRPRHRLQYDPDAGERVLEFVRRHLRLTAKISL